MVTINESNIPHLNRQFSYLLLSVLMAGFVSLLFPRCANIVQPTGGPRDTIPPEVVRSIPVNYSTGFTGTDIQIEFDEFIQLRNINQQFIITPPQKERPEFRVRGRNLFIDLRTELIANTTYTLNFGNAIVDLNEGNPLANYEFVFSTGDVIDSLSYSGIVLNAFDNKPVEGVIVMLYEELNDSVPYRRMPLYANRTGEDGRFNMNNLRADTFLVFAIDDANNNYLYDRPAEEKIAFLDDYLYLTPEKPLGPGIDTTETRTGSGEQPLEPGIDTTETRTGSGEQPLGPGIDTTETRTGSGEQPLGPGIDTTETRTGSAEGANGDINSHESIDSLQENRFVDADSQQTAAPLRQDTLYLFGEETGRQYLSRNERSERGNLLFVFNLPLEKEWSIEPVDFEPSGDWKEVEKNPRMDSIRFWIRDPEIRNTDNMRFLVSYWTTGPTDSLQAIIDTVSMNYSPPARSRRQTAAEEEYVMQVDFGIASGGNQDLHKDLNIRFPVPLESINNGKTELGVIQNNSPVQQEFDLVKDSLRIRNYRLITDWVQGQEYRFIAEPGAFTDIYGQESDSIEFAFKTRTEDHYGIIELSLTGVDDHIILQLLNERDQVLREFFTSENVNLTIDYLQPAKYRFKVIFDSNNNGRWDTGNYLEKIQPERVSFFNKTIATRANWVTEEHWDLEGDPDPVPGEL